MNFPTELLRLYVLTRYKAGATVKDMFLEMTQVHGKVARRKFPRKRRFIAGYKPFRMNALK
jgi:hypothetical protein